MELDPYRLPYRPPILSDLPASLLSIMEALPLHDALRLAHESPSWMGSSLDKRTLKRNDHRRASVYLPEPEALTKEHRIARVLGVERARAACAVVGGRRWDVIQTRTKEAAARVRQAFDLLDMGLPMGCLATWLDVGGKYAENLATTLDMWRTGSEPEAIQSVKGCSTRLLALALAHDLNRPGGVPAGLEPLEPPRLPSVEYLPGNLPALVGAVGMRDALTLANVAESMGRRVAAQLAESMGAPAISPPRVGQLMGAVKRRHGLDLLSLGYPPEEASSLSGVPGRELSALRAAVAAWREGADLEAAAEAGGMWQAGHRPKLDRLALVLWREW